MSTPSSEMSLTGSSRSEIVVSETAEKLAKRLARNEKDQELFTQAFNVLFLEEFRMAVKNDPFYFWDLSMDAIPKYLEEMLSNITQCPHFASMTIPCYPYQTIRSCDVDVHDTRLFFEKCELWQKSPYYIRPLPETDCYEIGCFYFRGENFVGAHYLGRLECAQLQFKVTQNGYCVSSGCTRLYIKHWEYHVRWENEISQENNKPRHYTSIQALLNAEFKKYDSFCDEPLAIQKKLNVPQNLVSFRKLIQTNTSAAKWHVGVLTKLKLSSIIEALKSDDPNVTMLSMSTEDKGLIGQDLDNLDPDKIKFQSDHGMVKTGLGHYLRFALPNMQQFCFQFFQSLAQNTQVTALDLSSSAFHSYDWAFTLLLEALSANNSIQRLDLRYNNFCASQLKQLLAIVASKPHMTHLGLDELKDLSIRDHVIPLIHAHPNLIFLSLRNMQLSKCLDDFEKLINIRTLKIELAGHELKYLSDEDWDKFRKIVLDNRKLIALTVQDTNMLRDRSQHWEEIQKHCKTNEIFGFNFAATQSFSKKTEPLNNHHLMGRSIVEILNFVGTSRTIASKLVSKFQVAQSKKEGSNPKQNHAENSQNIENAPNNSSALEKKYKNEVLRLSLDEFLAQYKYQPKQYFYPRWVYGLAKPETWQEANNGGHPLRKYVFPQTEQVRRPSLEYTFCKDGHLNLSDKTVTTFMQWWYIYHPTEWAEGFSEICSDIVAHDLFCIRYVYGGLNRFSAYMGDERFDKDFARFMQAQTQSTANSLFIVNNNITDLPMPRFKSFCDFLSHKKDLSVVFIQRYSLMTQDRAKLALFCDSILHNNSIKTLDLSKNQLFRLQDDLFYLFVVNFITNLHLDEFSLAENDLHRWSSRQFELFCSAVSKMRVSTLNLYGNGFEKWSDCDFSMFCDAVSKNKNIKQVKMNLSKDRAEILHRVLPPQEEPQLLSLNHLSLQPTHNQAASHQVQSQKSDKNIESSVHKPVALKPFAYDLHVSLNFSWANENSSDLSLSLGFKDKNPTVESISQFAKISDRENLETLGYEHARTLFKKSSQRPFGQKLPYFDSLTSETLEKYVAEVNKRIKMEPETAAHCLNFKKPDSEQNPHAFLSDWQQSPFFIRPEPHYKNCFVIGFYAYRVNLRENSFQPVLETQQVLFKREDKGFVICEPLMGKTATKTSTRYDSIQALIQGEFLECPFFDENTHQNKQFGTDLNNPSDPKDFYEIIIPWKKLMEEETSLFDLWQRLKKGGIFGKGKKTDRDMP